MRIAMLYMFRYGGHQSMFATGKNAVLRTTYAT
jgi:hypothetical protein